MEFNKLKLGNIKQQQLNSTQNLCEQLEAIFARKIPLEKKMILISKELKTFGLPGVSKLIKEIFLYDELLSDIANSSYFHKNGFCKIPIIKTDLYNVRLHVWNKGISSNETLHNHRWHLASTIIIGNLKSEHWEETSASAGKICDEYLYSDKLTKPKFNRKIHVALKETITRNSGDFYTMRPEKLHRLIKSDSAMAVTLICHSAPVRKFARNIIVNEIVPCVYPDYLTKEILSESLHDVMRSISGNKCEYLT